jgi:membrane protease YdiL (CAAX protease family)
VILWTGFFVVQSMGEEVICRGYLLRVWTRSLNLPAGLFISSTVFAAGHLGNPGFNALAFLNSVLAGILLGVLYARVGSLWLVAGIHAGWNTAQPLLGVPLSGRTIRITPLEIHYTDGDAWSGGQYGVEASLPAAAVLLLLCGVAAYENWPARRKDCGIWHPLPEAIPNALEVGKLGD